jgi:hypothetical protein
MPEAGRAQSDQRHPLQVIKLLGQADGMRTLGEYLSPEYEPFQAVGERDTLLKFLAKAMAG